MFRCVTSTYHSLFHSMEALGILDPKNEIDQVIRFVRHGIDTAEHWTPYKVWMNSIMSHTHNQFENIPDIEEFGINEEASLPGEQVNIVFVPQTHCGK